MATNYSSSKSAPDTAQTDASTTAYYPSLAYKLFIPFGRILLRYFTAIWSPRLKITGRHHIPWRGPVIIAPNHLSNADPPYVLYAVPRPLWFMAKRELFDMPSIAWIIRLVQSFPVEPDSADRAALHFAQKLLEHGQGVVIFPEGRCSPDAKLGPLQPGVIMLALRMQVPIVPLGIYGTNHVVNYHDVWPRPTLAPVRLHFGKAVTFDDLAELPRREQRQVATARLERAMRLVARQVGTEVSEVESGN